MTPTGLILSVGMEGIEEVAEDAAAQGVKPFFCIALVDGVETISTNTEERIMKRSNDPEMDALTHEYLSGEIKYREYKQALAGLIRQRTGQARAIPQPSTRPADRDREIER